jgi:hypothetical protein
MTQAEADFRKWFVDSLEPLKRNGDAGFVFLIAAFPLLERYLRRKSNCPDGGPLPDLFFSNLGSLFPDIAGHEKEFWNCYRHGLLHQATFSRQKLIKKNWEPLPSAAISGHQPSPVYYLSDAKEFFLNPVAFFETVTREILANFDTYESVGAGYYHLASVVGGFTAVPGCVPTINMRLPQKDSGSPGV